MRISRFSMAALMLAVGLASVTVMAATPAPATPPATAPAKTGSVSGKVVDKDGKPVANLQVRAIDAALAAAPGGGARGGRGAGRGGRGARGPAAPTTDADGAFTLKDVPVGKMVITATSAFGGGRGAAPATPPATAPVFLRGTSDPVNVMENQEAKLPNPIKVEEVAMPAGRGGRGGRGAGGAGGAPRGAGGADGGMPPAGN